jgi:hypothetical protein
MSDQYTAQSKVASARTEETASEHSIQGYGVGPHTGDVEENNPPLSDTGAHQRKPPTWWKEILGIVVSALSLVGLCILLKCFDGKADPKWSYTLSATSDSPVAKSRTISLNSIISLFSGLARVCLVIPLASGVSQLKWVWFAQDKRVLTDFTAFDAAARGDPIDNAQLMWTLRGK